MRLLATLFIMFAVCSLQAQSKPAKQRDTVPVMSFEHLKYFQSLGQSYLVTEALPVDIKQHANPVSTTNPVPAGMTSTVTSSAGRKSPGLHQTIVFDRYGNSRMITTIRIR